MGSASSGATMRYKSAFEPELMRRIKAARDPHGLMNPPGLFLSYRCPIDRIPAWRNRGKHGRRHAVAEAGITVTLPKPMTSGAKSQGRFGKQDFVPGPGRD
jgi:hypothetical protein